MELAQGTLGYQLVVSWHATDGKEHNLAVTWHTEDVLGFYFSFGGRARVEQVCGHFTFLSILHGWIDPGAWWSRNVQLENKELNLGTQSEQVCISDNSF